MINTTQFACKTARGVNFKNIYVICEAYIICMLFNLRMMTIPTKWSPGNFPVVRAIFIDNSTHNFNWQNYLFSSPINQALSFLFTHNGTERKQQKATVSQDLCVDQYGSLAESEFSSLFSPQLLGASGCFCIVLRDNTLFAHRDEGRRMRDSSFVWFTIAGRFNGTRVRVSVCAWISVSRCRMKCRSDSEISHEISEQQRRPVTQNKFQNFIWNLDLSRYMFHFPTFRSALSAVKSRISAQRLGQGYLPFPFLGIISIFQIPTFRAALSPMKSRISAQHNPRLGQDWLPGPRNRGNSYLFQGKCPEAIWCTDAGTTTQRTTAP